MKSSNEKFGVLVYEELQGRFNIGDYIQSLAALGFAKSESSIVYVSRENASIYDGDPIKLIMNGWFTHTTTNNWIPSEKIHPLLISFHLNESSVPFLLNNEGIEFFKKNQPIGCRDKFTVDSFRKNGIESNFTGCLTLTLDKYNKGDIERKGIYIVDPLYNYPDFSKITQNYRVFIKSFLNRNIFKLNKKQNHLERIFDKELLNEAEYITHVLPANTYSYDEKFKIADELLEKYSTAKLVITSRIHCALPCLAMGTPVIYVNGFDNFFDTCRFDGLLELFNRIDIDSNTGEFTTNFYFNGDKVSSNVLINNPTNYIPLAEAMKETCNGFMK